MGQNPKRKVKLAPWGWFLWILIWYNRHHVISCQLLYCIWHERSVLEKLWKNGAQIHVRSLYVNLSYFSLVFYFILSFSILFHFLLFYFNLSISHFCQAQFQLASPVPVELRLAPPGKVKMHLEIDHMVSWRQEQHPIMNFAVPFLKMLTLYMLWRAQFLSDFIFAFIRS